MRKIYFYAGVIGNTNDNTSSPHSRVEEYEDELPENEQHNGIQGVNLHAYGDSLDSAFLEVYGPDENEVFHKWNQISALSLGFLQAWWEE